MNEAAQFFLEQQAQTARQLEYERKALIALVRCHRSGGLRKDSWTEQVDRAYFCSFIDPYAEKGNFGQWVDRITA